MIFFSYSKVQKRRGYFLCPFYDASTIAYSKRSLQEGIGLNRFHDCAIGMTFSASNRE